MLYRFILELSDVDRGVYESLDFRVAQHPSETAVYLLSRVLAYALSYQEGLEFTPGGLGDPEAPALRILGGLNSIDLWIEIGNPSARKLHKASKAAKQVAVFTYKNPEVLLEEVRNHEIHRKQELRLFALDAGFLQNLEPHLEKNNRWSVLVQQGRLDVDIAGRSFSTEIRTLSL